MVERRDLKKRKKQTWSAKGGHIAPIFIPPTPNGALAKRLQQIADSETEAGAKFKIVETGGVTMKQQLQKSNPTASPACDKDDCAACKFGRGKGGNCHRNNIEYEFECQLCHPGRRAVYLGETARNLYTRAKEHEEKYRKGKQKLFMKKHQD